MTSILDRIFAQRVAGRVYGLGAVVLGLEGLAWGDFAVVWQPDADAAAGPGAVGYAVAILPLLAGLAMQWRRSARLGAIALTLLYGLAEIFLDIPRGFAHPAVLVAWYGVAEHLALAAAGLIICAYCVPVKPTSAEGLVKIARVSFGACLIYFGLAHHFYLANTVTLVPAWLPPGQTFWAYATGLGHIAAGIAIISGRYARTAARLLTAMFLVFAILVHAPRVILDPHTHFNWAENAINFALVGAAWVVAASLAPQTKTRAAAA